MELKIYNPQADGFLKAIDWNFEELKEEIQKVREDGYENTNIIEMSENYFYLADETVDAAEEYSQYCASQLDMIEKGLIEIGRASCRERV